MIAAVLQLLLGAAGEPVRVGPGAWAPLYVPPDTPPTVAVPAFRLDRTPVTNAEFLAFVQANPQWRRDRIPRIQADVGYLAAWADPVTLSVDTPPSSPVVQVSWFAARAYCAARGQRLPTEAEWELAAAAGERGPDGRAEDGWTARILAWYARPSRLPLPAVGQGAPNWWGVHDLHGLVWEWVEDVNSLLVSPDNRDQGGADTTVFCGAGALGSATRDDYAAFMRVAFRSSLRGDMTTRTLGFRCASDP